MPGVVELAQEIFGIKVKLYVPNQVGIRNPMFANVISLVEYVGTLTDVDKIAQSAVLGEERLRRKPIDIPTYTDIKQIPKYEGPKNGSEINGSEVSGIEPSQELPSQVSEKPQDGQKITERVRGMFGKLFD